MLTQQIVSGLAAGSLYALAALGLVLIYKTSDLVNFAQGEMAMISTFFGFTVMHSLGFGYWISFLAALVFAALFGMLVENIFMRPVQKAPVLSQIILTLGLYMAFRGIAGMIWGYEPTSYPVAVEGEPIEVGSIVVTPNQIFIFALTLVLMFLFFCLFRFTLTGLAMRAAAQNLRTAELMGIRVGAIFSLTWAISAVLGGIAGILIAPTTFLDPNMMGEVAIKAFAAAVLGGFASLPGAVIGGLSIGLFENLVAGYVSAELKTAFVFFLIIFILYVKPTGLLGIKQVKKV
ncbi:branched-chain amino acid ABC transporter permease [Effusibacillus consociatus]|uniref:Branched-chain amino acid ABC transporter permease n=1 Tax=Effusibacillus consociatus TaxID=1117041 RepID=A0ABV9Q0Q2_9BACL